MASSLTAARLRELLNYNPATGIFTWRINRRGRGGCYAGKRAGTQNQNGHWQIGIDGRLYIASRLAVLYMVGRMPRRLVDHRDRNPNNDRWKNLRPANHSQNGANSVNRKGNRLFKGVIFIPPKGTQRPAKPYHARIKVNYRFIHLGSFKTPKKAHIAYLTAARKYFGEFARR